MQLCYGGGGILSADELSDLVITKITSQTPTQTNTDPYTSIAFKGTTAGTNEFSVTLNGTTYYFEIKNGATVLTALGTRVTAGSGDIRGNFYKLSTTVNGGAIFNNTGGTINSITGDFIGNSATVNGGAIYNDEGTISSITGDFIGNSATVVNGGAIYNNEGTISSITGDFIGNSASSFGGAIFNTVGTIGSIRGDFIGNSATRDGGAILNINGTITIKEATFTGNTANGVSNAIHNEDTGTINLSANSGKEIVFNDRITGDISGAINIDGVGRVVLNENMSGYRGVTNFSNGTIQIGSSMGVDGSGYTNFFGGDFNVSGANTTLNSQNGVIDKFNTASWTTTSTNRLNVALDIDATAGTSDFFDKNGDDAQFINISSINIFNPKDLTNEEFVVTNDGTNFTIDDEAKTIEVNSSVYRGRFDVNSDSLVSDGKIALTSGEIIGVNDGAVATQVANQSNITSSITVNNKILNRVDRNSRASKVDRVTIKEYFNKDNYVANVGQTPLNLEDIRTKEQTQSTLWVEAFGSFEKIDTNVEVDVDTYGILFGYDSMDYNLSNFDLSYGFYLGLSSSESKYSDITIDQRSSFFGGGVNFYRGNFILNTLATIGYLDNEMTNSNTQNTFYSKDDYGNMILSLTTKLSYNYLLKDNYVIQPNLALSYFYISSEDYTNSNGVRVDTKSSNSFQILPAIKFGYYKENFETYVQLGYSFLENTQIKSNIDGINLQSEKLDNYGELKLGISQDIDNLRVYSAISGTIGGVEGASLQAGLEWIF